MNNPEKTPPASVNAVLASDKGPVTEVPPMSSQSFAASSNAPTLNPPERSESAGAVGAAVWTTDKRVNGLYTTFNPRNSWMSIAGVGWKKLATGSDSMCEAMTDLAAHAREKNCRIDYAEENGLVTQIYVW
jgi:hypothetical protein